MPTTFRTTINFLIWIKNSLLANIKRFITRNPSNSKTNPERKTNHLSSKSHDISSSNINEESLMELWQFLLQKGIYRNRSHVKRVKNHINGNTQPHKKRAGGNGTHLTDL